MLRKWSGNIAILTLALANIALWLIFTPVDDGTRAEYGRQLPGEILSSTAMVLMASALFLSTRPRYLESFFGGLDKMYVAHKNAGLAALLLVISHFLVVPIGGDDSAPAHIPTTFFVDFLIGIFGRAPFLESLGETLGLIAFAGLIVLVLLTVAPRLPLIGAFTRFSYSKWKWTHKLIGIFFIIGFFHSVTVDSLVLTEPVLLTVLVAVSAIGAVSYIYAELLAFLFTKKYPFTVESVERLNGTTVEVSLKSQGRKPDFKAGQFAFVGFSGVRGLGEPHPFTVACPPGEDNLRFAIKASGDWTRRLNANLAPGARAKVDGCYGRFDYRKGGPEQIWVAGGIGITPFISWVREFKNGPDADVDMFYSVRGSGDLLFLDELAAADGEYDNFRLHTRVSSEDGNLTVQEIGELCRGQLRNKHVYMCGPIAMMDAMERQFRRLGVGRGNIHYEEFNFR